MSCPLMVDYRERRSGVPEALERAGFLVEYKQQEADYAWSDSRWWVERKTWEDFFNSLNETEVVNEAKVSKLVRQLYKAKSGGADCTLIVEGLPFVNSDGTILDRRWKRSSIDPLLVRLSLRGVRIMFTRDAHNTAIAIGLLYRLTHEHSTVWPSPALDYVLVPTPSVPWITNARKLSNGK